MWFDVRHLFSAVVPHIRIAFERGHHLIMNLFRILQFYLFFSYSRRRGGCCCCLGLGARLSQLGVITCVVPIASSKNPACLVKCGILELSRTIRQL